MASPFAHKALVFSQRHFSALLRPVQSCVAATQYFLLDLWWAIKGYRKPSDEDVRLVSDNVTFIFKSFERQKQAKALYRSIQKYYPGTRVVIADDSSQPLDLTGDGLTVIQMPFNSGLSKGLNMALEKVETPFLVRMDDDELLTRHLNIADELRFLESHPIVDIVGFPCIDAGKSFSTRKRVKAYFKHSMSEAPKALIIPHGTSINNNHVVLGKVTNIYVARTESIRKVGWDDNIRMIDHHDFFFRAAGILVSTLSVNGVVFHNHNYFDPKYNHYHSDCKSDMLYIRQTRYRHLAGKGL